jgi:hypothetical protein
MEPFIVFFVGLLLLGCLFLRRASLIEALEHHGVTMMATVTGIEQHWVLTKVTAYWQHPQTRQVHPCHSWMLFNPLTLRPGSLVPVLVDPANTQRYYIRVAR